MTPPPTTTTTPKLRKAADLVVGDVLLLPFGKTATVARLVVPGPRGRYVQLWTEHGKSRVETGYEFLVERAAVPA